MATPVACGWAYLRSVKRLGKSSKAKKFKNAGKVKCDGPIEGPTDRRTDKAGCRVACTRLKTQMVNKFKLLQKTSHLADFHF